MPVTITGTGSYSQNFSTGLTDIRLPQLNVAINQFYLFKPKTGVRTGLLENINVNTGLQFSNYVSGVKMMTYLPRQCGIKCKQKKKKQIH